jgi:hypothetical protein
VREKPGFALPPDPTSSSIRGSDRNDHKEQKNTHRPCRAIVKRRSIRLQGHDYSSVNVYFITICSYQKECFFGEIRNGIMGLNDFGLVIRKSWLDTEMLRSNVLLGDFVIMPNHFHAIIWITGGNPPRGRGTARRAL